MKKIIVSCTLAIALMLALGASAWAAGAQSAHYKVTVDAVACGGGSSGSAHYRNLDSSIGQDSPAGLASSSARRENSGVIQYWPFAKNAADSWTLYY
ncbi:MAG: hypothetical protein ABFD69_11280 [Candidatus Sumerlaeia bacterium]